MSHRTSSLKEASTLLVPLHKNQILNATTNTSCFRRRQRSLYRWRFYHHYLFKEENMLCDRPVPGVCVCVWMCAGTYSDAASWLLYNRINGTVSLSDWMGKGRLGFTQSSERAWLEKKGWKQVETWLPYAKPACPLSYWWLGVILIWVSAHLAIIT